MGARFPPGPPPPPSDPLGNQPPGPPDAPRSSQATPSGRLALPHRGGGARRWVRRSRRSLWTTARGEHWLVPYRDAVTQTVLGESTIITVLSESGDGTPYQLPSTATAKARSKEARARNRYFKIPP